MNYPRRSTVTFLFKLSAISAFVLMQIGCSSTLSSNSGNCASNDDCLGAQSCVDGRCAMECFSAQDCAASETCVFNRCQGAPEVYEDMGMAIPDSALVSDTDATTDETDSALADMGMPEVDQNMAEFDQSMPDMFVGQDMTLLDASLLMAEDSGSDGDMSLDDSDASAQDATL